MEKIVPKNSTFRTSLLWLRNSLEEAVFVSHQAKCGDPSQSPKCPSLLMAVSETQTAFTCCGLVPACAALWGSSFTSLAQLSLFPLLVFSWDFVLLLGAQRRYMKDLPWEGDQD